MPGINPKSESENTFSYLRAFNEWDKLYVTAFLIRINFKESTLCLTLFIFFFYIP